MCIDSCQLLRPAVSERWHLGRCGRIQVITGPVAGEDILAALNGMPSCAELEGG